MPINTREILNLVSKVTEHKQVRVCLKESFKGGCIAAAATMVGGILFGPPGLAIGGAMGGCTAAVMSRDKFKPVPQIIMQDMTPEQQESLARSVNVVLSELRIEDAAMLIPLVMNDKMIMETVLKEVYTFLQNEMQLQIVD